MNLIRFVTLIAGGGDTTAAALNADIVAYWAMDETSGNRADSVGSITLTDNNTVGFDTGIQGNGAAFVAANSESLSTSAIDLDEQDFSFFLWFKTPSTLSGLDGIIGAYTGSNATGHMLLDSSGSNLEFRMIHSSGQTIATLTSALAADTWYSVYIEYIFSTRKMYLRLNDTTATDPELTANGFNSASNPDLHIGAASASAFFSDFVIDEVGFWRRALTAEEITWLHNGGAGRTYPFS